MTKQIVLALAVGATLGGAPAHADLMDQYRAQYAQLTQIVHQCNAQMNQFLNYSRNAATRGQFPGKPPPCHNNMPRWIAALNSLEIKIQGWGSAGMYRPTPVYRPAPSPSYSTPNTAERDSINHNFDLYIRGNHDVVDQYGVTHEVPNQ
jgi:hypothetical protein